MGDLDDRRGEDRRDAAVDRVAARGDHPRAGFGRERTPGGDDPVAGADLTADRRGGLGRQGAAREQHCRGDAKVVAASHHCASYYDSRPD